MVSEVVATRSRGCEKTVGRGIDNIGSRMDWKWKNIRVAL